MHTHKQNKSPLCCQSLSPNILVVVVVVVDGGTFVVVVVVVVVGGGIRVVVICSLPICLIKFIVFRGQYRNDVHWDFGLQKNDTEK